MRSSLRSRIKALTAAMLFFSASYAINAEFQKDSNKFQSLPIEGNLLVEGSPAIDVNSHWQSFTRRSQSRIGVNWHPQIGTAEALFGKLASLDIASEKNARKFLAENRMLFKMSQDLSDLTLTRDFQTPLGSHFVFQQKYQDIPVYGAQTSVHFNQQAEIVAVNNAYLPNINLASVTPNISKEDALQVAGLELKVANLSEATSELVVYPYNDTIALAWHINIPTSRHTWELFIDAQRGGLLGEIKDINRYVNGTGKVFNVNAVVATRNNGLRDNNNADSAVPSSAYSTVTLQGLVGNGFLDGQYASSKNTKKRVSNSSNSFIYTRSSDGFSEVMVYHFIDYTQRYIQSLGFTNINNRQIAYTVNSSRADNSFYSPSSKSLNFGTGGVDDAEDAEVVFHEYGHSIQDNQVPGYGSSREGGAMGEGFGDYLAGSVGAQLSGGFQDVCVAEWDATSYSSANPPCLRRLDSTKHYPESVVNEVHADGEMWSAALWQIRASIGASRADKVILQSHFLLTSSANFSQGSNAIVTAAINLGYTSTEVNNIRTILRNRGFNVTA
ncbi:MAG: M36 family metallopeptidase [Acidobacteria bacterium]|nr:M36 family metallopeptidase [Acidobacteriota bacterium]